MPRGTPLAVIEIVPHQSDVVLRVIGGFKLLKTLMLIAGGIGMISLGEHGNSLGWQTHVDPGNHYVNAALAKLSSTSPHEIEELGVGCFVYAALFATEGLGLVFRKLWAEYLTIVITGSFIPLEIYEMVHHKSWVKAAVIVVNVAIVVYLVLRLRRDKQWPFR
jgi:uncharacterized membrane protein (DUF2068 family)